MAACWYGLDENKVMSHLSPNPAMVIWRAAMSSIHENLKVTNFKIPSDCQLRKYCTSSGLCARTGCYSIAYGYFKKSYTPFCSIHGGSETGVLSQSGYYDTNSNNSNRIYSKKSTTSSQDSEKTTQKTSTTDNQDDTKGKETQASGKPAQNTTNSPPEKTKATEASVATEKKSE